MQLTNKKRTIAAVALFLFYSLFLISLPSNLFWNGDNGMKYIQAISLLDHKFSSLQLSYPAKVIDPESQFAPFDPSFCVQTQQGIFGQYSAYYIFFLALFLKAFGSFGSTIFLFCGGCFFLWRILLLQKNLSSDSRFLSLSLLGTPVLFYLFNLYETVWLCGFIVLFLEKYLTSDSGKSTAFIAGLSLAALPGLRIEGYLYAFFLGIAYVFSRSHQTKQSFLLFVFGVLFPLLPLWIFHHFQFGQFFGPMLATNHQFTVTNGWSLWERLSNRIDIVLFGIRDVPFFMSHFVFYYVFGFLIFLASLKWKSLRTPFFYLLCLGCSALSVYYFHTKLMDRSFFLPAPFLIFLFSYPETMEKKEKLLRLASLGIIFTVTLFLFVEVPSDWGSRYLVPLYIPCLLLILKRTTHKTIFYLLILLGLIQEVQVLQELKSRLETYSERSLWISERPEKIVLTDSPFSTQLYARLYCEKYWMYLFSMRNLMTQNSMNRTDGFGELFQKFLNILESQDIQNFIFISELSTFCEENVKTGSNIEIELPSGKVAQFHVIQKILDRGQSVLVALHWNYRPA